MIEKISKHRGYGPLLFFLNSFSLQSNDIFYHNKCPPPRISVGFMVQTLDDFKILFQNNPCPPCFETQNHNIWEYKKTTFFIKVVHTLSDFKLLF